jgi:hypothetical protein
MKINSFVIYRIYDDFGLMYVGKTAQPLNQRLHGHFFAKPMMRKLSPRAVNLIEYAVCKTAADMNLYEIYYIEKLKPPYNFANKHSDELSITLPDLTFSAYECKLLEKWRKEIEIKEQDESEQNKRKLSIELQEITLRQKFREKLLTGSEFHEKIKMLQGGEHNDE